MNRKIEISIYVVLIVLFGIAFIKDTPQSSYYLYFTIALWAGFGALLTISRFYISPKLLNKEYKSGLIYIVSSLLISFLICGYLYSNYLADVTKTNSVSIFEPLVIQETLPYLVFALLIGLVNTIRIRKALFLKISYSMAGVIAIILVVFLIKYNSDVKYKGDESVKFIEENHQTLHAVLQSKDFVDKVVYVDLWFSSCGPCIQEFKVMPYIKESLKNENVEYLYLARKTSHPNDVQLWKNAIKKYNLTGHHIYMSPELEEDVWTLIEENTKNTSEGYPHYLIVSGKNVIVSYNAYRPSDKELLISQLKKIRLE